MGRPNYSAGQALPALATSFTAPSNGVLYSSILLTNGSSTPTDVSIRVNGTVLLRLRNNTTTEPNACVIPYTLILNKGDVVYANGKVITGGGGTDGGVFIPFM